MAKLLINRREFSIGATALLASLSNFSSFAGSKIKVAGIYTVPIQQKWVARLHLALEAAAKNGEIDYVYSESTANTDYVRVMREYCDSGMQFIVGEAFGISKEARKVADDVDSYGKGAVVGLDGELEHAAALLHPRFGAPVRKAVGSGKDIIPSTKKLGGPGSTLVMPITNKNNIWSFDDMDAAEITVPDAPKSDEILIAVCLAIGGRPLKRIKPD